VRDAVFKPEQIKRTAPLALTFPKNINNHFEITFESDGFQLKVASFDQVKNIEVEYSEDKDSNTIITIKRKDSTEFTLFVSTVERGDNFFLIR
jgi:hypothetical protein